MIFKFACLYTIECVWYQTDQIGVKFTSVVPVEKDMPAGLSLAYKIWLESQPRQFVL